MTSLVQLTSPAAPLDPAALPAAVADGLYVHVPFCAHKCHYCDFYSITRQGGDRMARFVDLTLAEAAMWADSPVTIRPRTVFFGGGTPSLLPIDEMRRLLRGLRDRLDLSDAGEWTIEVNPATAALDYCHMLREHGVDRLSFGAQSFDRRELALLERHHDPDDVPRSVELATAAGFRRLNVDLIFALPGQSAESWHRSLSAALSLGTTHLSCYALTFEPNTPMAVRQRLGQIAATPEPLELQLLHETRDRLTSLGMPAYEVSNFAAAGQACRHNLNYWMGGNYVGLGPAAASHVAGVRWRNRPHLGEWERAVGGQARLPAADVERLTAGQRAGELAMLMLRLETGFDLAHCRRLTGVDAADVFGPTIRQLVGVGLVTADGDRVRLTRRGVDVADAVAGEFVAATA